MSNLARLLRIFKLSFYKFRRKPAEKMTEIFRKPQDLVFFLLRQPQDIVDNPIMFSRTPVDNLQKAMDGNPRKNLENNRFFCYHKVHLKG